MQEYVTKALVLDKASRGGEADTRYFFFTERYGKISARAKSSRKIVSKLAGHLEPGTLASVRIIEQHGTQVVDALKIDRMSIALADLARLNELMGEWEPDRELWQEISGGRGISWTNALAILGWDPRGAVCARCARADARHFFIPRQEFFCANCVSISRFPKDHLLLT